MEINVYDKIEYHYLNVPYQGKRLLEQLNELGKAGWEYIFKEGNTYWFKRVLRNTL